MTDLLSRCMNTAPTKPLTLEDLLKAARLLDELAWPKLQLHAQDMTTVHRVMEHLGVESTTNLLEPFGIPVHIKECVPPGEVWMVVEHQHMPPDIHIIKL